MCYLHMEIMHKLNIGILFYINFIAISKKWNNELQV